MPPRPATAVANAEATDALRATRDAALAHLAETGPVGAYAEGGEGASEPTAWATLALTEAQPDDPRRAEAARRGAAWLADRQADDGSVGVTATSATPAWPTALAMIAWDAVDPTAYAERVRRGAEWALAEQPWTEERHRIFGHDTTLEGWSWAPHTHSWLEPTAFFVAALRRTGHAGHPRYNQAVRLLIDRLLPSGGVNYGNTIVLGQELLQHLQPSGIVAWALAGGVADGVVDAPAGSANDLWAFAGEAVNDARFNRTLDYLRRSASEPTGVASLAYAVLGLTAHGADASAWRGPLVAAWPRALRAGGVYKPALVALAADALLRSNEPNLASRS